jgi:hypothetical protein
MFFGYRSVWHKGCPSYHTKVIPKGGNVMSANLLAKKYPFGAYVEQKAMRRQKVIKTTLGELIVALTDEVVPFVRDPSALYKVVSWVLNDVLTHRRQRAQKTRRLRYPNHLAKASL